MDCLMCAASSLAHESTVRAPRLDRGRFPRRNSGWRAASCARSATPLSRRPCSSCRASRAKTPPCAIPSLTLSISTAAATSVRPAAPPSSPSCHPIPLLSPYPPLVTLSSSCHPIPLLSPYPPLVTPRPRHRLSDLTELEVGLATFEAQAAKAKEEQALLAGEIDKMVAHAVLCDRAAEAASTAEATQAAIEFEPTEATSVELRAGRQFIKFSKDESKISKLWQKWDVDGNGTIDISEVVEGFKSVGIRGTDEELRSLANTLDEDRSGTLELSELKAGIELMMERRRASEQKMKELRTKLNEQRTACTQTQRAASQALALLDVG